VAWVIGVVVPLVIVAIGSIGGLVGYVLRSRLDDIRDAERRLAEERRKLYSDLLAPYIEIFGAIGSADAGTTTPIPPARMRKLGFDLMLVGSDDVVRAYNRMMQHVYRNPDESLEILHFWALLLLEVRRSLGSARTELNEVDMVRFALIDIHTFEDHVRQHRED
jgi:hypothetical protein